MKFAKGKSYKVLEMPDCLVITSSNQQVAGADPLVIADSPAMLVYLERFVRAREGGADKRTAHDLALKTAGVTIVNPPA